MVIAIVARVNTVTFSTISYNKQMCMLSLTSMYCFAAKRPNKRTTIHEKGTTADRWGGKAQNTDCTKVSTYNWWTTSKLKSKSFLY